jgi:hypothetical protein
MKILCFAHLPRLLTVDFKPTFSKERLDTFMIYLHSKSHVPGSSVSFVITPKAKTKFSHSRHVVILRYTENLPERKLVISRSCITTHHFRTPDELRCSSCSELTSFASAILLLPTVGNQTVPHCDVLLTYRLPATLSVAI